MNSPSISSVRKCISRKNLESSFSKSLYYVIRDVFLFILLSVLIIKNDNIFVLIPLWILQGLSILALFQLSHDAAHGALFRNRTFSWWIGQLCMLPSLVPFHQWVYGHNRLHHGNTCKLKADLAWHPRTKERYLKMSMFDKVMHRIYWSVVGGGIYYLFKMWLQGLILHPAPNFKAKRDIYLIVIFMLVSSFCSFYFAGTQSGDFDIRDGFWMFSKLQLIPFLIWNYTIGIIVYMHHISPDIEWKREGWTRFYGQVECVTNYHIPKIINFFAHNIFLHTPHHIDARIPFYHLPAALRDISFVYGNSLKIRSSFFSDYLRSVHSCKLISSTGAWLRF